MHASYTWLTEIFQLRGTKHEDGFLDTPQSKINPDCIYPQLRIHKQKQRRLEGDGCDTINMILLDNIAIVTDIFGPIYYIYEAS